MEIDLKQFFEMSKLKPRDLDIEKVIEMIEKIQSVETSGIGLYYKDWIKHKVRSDEKTTQTFDLSCIKQQSDKLFKVPKVLKES